MPRAPASNVTPIRPPVTPGTQPTDTDLAMALAMMHAEGKLDIPQESLQLAGDVVPLQIPIKGPTFRRGTSGKPIPLTPENIDRAYPQPTQPSSKG